MTKSILNAHIIIIQITSEAVLVHLRLFNPRRCRTISFAKSHFSPSCHP